jgi:hypothetical protein
MKNIPLIFLFLQQVLQNRLFFLFPLKGHILLLSPRQTDVKCVFSEFIVFVLIFFTVSLE